MNNSQAIEVGTFREIFLDPSTIPNKLISNTGNLSILTAFLEAPSTERRTFSNKKKAKSQVLAKYLVAKGSIKTKTPKEPTPLLVAIELI